MDTQSLTWAFVKAVERAPDLSGVQSSLINFASQFGFTSAFGGCVPQLQQRSASQDIKSRILVQRFPREWASRYNSRNYVFRDPIVHRLQHDRSPFSWADSYASCSVGDDVKLIHGEASEFGLKSGHVFPVVTLDREVTAVSFGGSHIEIDDDSKAALAFATSFAIGHMLTLRSERRAFEKPLTPRESDCLLWASDGKTDWEIAVILGISRSTVIKHLLAARDKLGAVNRAHTVANAIRRREIR